MLKFFTARGISIVVLLLLLNACTNTHRIKSISESSAVESEFAEEEAYLDEQSRQLYVDLKQRGLIYRDPQLNNFLGRLGHKLVPTHLKSTQAFRFFIVKNAIPNAFALPNGDIYVNLGLLAVVENEDQLASILAHEISHVVDRHSLKSMINRKETIITAHIADVFLLGLGISYLPAAANLAGFSRDQEKEADIHGLDIISKAGYSIDELPRAFEQFLEIPGATANQGSIYNSHPDNIERISYLQKLIHDQYGNTSSSQPGVNDFQATRFKILEDTVKISLLKNQYQLTLHLLKLASPSYRDFHVIENYYGDTYRKMAERPGRAAHDEAQNNGNSYTDDAFKKHSSAIPSNIKIARQHYANALKSKPDYALAYRGLGLLERLANNNETAVRHLKKYLELAANADDVRYIDGIIQKLIR